MKKLLLLGNCTLFAALCPFIFSPLRLNTDSMRLFAMALPAAVGGAYGTDQFPPFYPHLLCGLIRAGWCNSVVLLSINFTALFLTLLLLYKIMRLNGYSFVETMATITSVQLCWCIAKHVLLPQTDVLLLPFFFSCLLSVMYAERSENWARKAIWLVVATLIASVATVVRTAAIPLFAVIAVVATGVTPKNFLGIIRKRVFWLSALSLCAALVLGVVLAIKFTEFDAEGGYFKMFKTFFMRGGVAEFLAVGWSHLNEIMQLSLNVTSARIPRFVAEAGAVVMPIFLAWAVIKGWQWLDWCLLLALLGYGLEIFLWPCNDARFFLPVFPIAAMLMVHFAQGLWQKHKLVRPVICLYVAGFMLMGFVSWGWLARQWYLGKDFYMHTTNGFLSSAFKNAYTLEIKDIPENERTFPVFILKKFDPLHSCDEKEWLPLTDYYLFPSQHSD